MTDALHATTDKLLRRLVRRDAAGAVRKLLRASRPQDVAAAMEHLTSDEQRRLYLMIDDLDYAAEVLAHLDDASSREVVQGLDRERVIDILDRMDPDDATDVVEALPDALRAQIINDLPDDMTAEAVRGLLEYDPDTAGGLMSTNVFKLRETATCGEAIRALQREHEDLVTDHYVYVVDVNERLLGVMALRSLLIHSASTPVTAVMTRDVITVAPHEDQEVVARIVARYDLLALPVVDEQQVLLGIVTVDDVLDVIKEEHAEDLLLMAGVVDYGHRGGVLHQARDRGGWLIATLAGGILATEIIDGNQATLEQVAVLAGFIPVIMGMGGNVGIQSATIAVRGVATGSVLHTGPWRFVYNEARVGLTLGLLFALLLGTYGTVRFWTDNPLIGPSVAVSILFAMVTASVMGAAMPVLLNRFGVDPAIATGPFVTTGVDILSITIYLNIARLLLGL